MPLPTRDFLDRLADAADAETLPLFRAGVSVEAKQGQRDFDPVTAADRNAELAMRRVIMAAYPGHGIAGEEFEPVHPDAREIWHLDPIDGTRQFITGVPLWGTLAGLSVDGVPVLGLISQPFTGERFYGTPDGAFVRRGNEVRPMTVRECPDLAGASLFTTSPHLYDGANADRLAAMRAQVRLTRYGLDCYAFALLALGTVDIVMESGVQAYDILPLVPIIEAAGGAVVDWQGARLTGGGDVLAVGDRRLLEPALAVLQGR